MNRSENFFKKGRENFVNCKSKKKHKGETIK